MKDKHKGKIISEEQKEKIKNTLTKKRIPITKKCENCDKEFEIIIIENGVNRIRKCCTLSCSSKLSNKNRNK
jgi:hypothetical protein